MTVEFVTSVGRIVWGNPARSVIKKDQNTKQPVLRDGKQVEQWAFGIAFPKAEFGQSVLPFLQQAVAAVYPNGVPPQFSWKIKDGDGVDRRGKPYNERDGYAGNYILTVSTEAFAPPIYKNEGGRYRQMAENEIKTGDYVVVKLNVKANAPANASHTPGLYINPMGVEHVGYGAEIVGSSADPDEMFGGRTYALPPGATATPQATNSNVAAPFNTGGAPAAAPAANFAPAAPTTPAANFAPAAPVAPAWPPVGWTQHPQNPAYFYNAGGECITEADLRARMTPAAPVAPTAPAAPAPGNMPPPAANFITNAGTAPNFAPAAMPGMMPGR